ncbi:YjbH domain-containing protein [Bacteroidota bacterium]
MNSSINPFTHSSIQACVHSSKRILLILIFSFILYPLSLVPAQSLTGPSGLFTIPTADILNDGRIFIGANYQDRKYVEYSNYERDILTGSASISFLPFLEITIRGTRRLNIPDTEKHVMDRFIGVKYKFFNEGKYFPSLTVGLNNPLNADPAANHFNSSYIVATKNIESNILVDNISLTLGYGSDFIDATDYQFIGIFGGASIDLYLTQSGESSVSFMVEYDADRLNGGVRLTLFDHVNILAGMIGFDSFSGGIGILFNL